MRFFKESIVVMHILVILSICSPPPLREISSELKLCDRPSYHWSSKAIDGTTIKIELVLFSSKYLVRQ